MNAITFEVLCLDGEVRQYRFDRTAVVAVDPQNVFIKGELGTPQAVKAMKNVKNIFDFPFKYHFATQDTHKDYQDTLEGKYLPVEHGKEGTEGWAFPVDFTDSWNYIVHVFRKETFGSKRLAETIDTLFKLDLLDCVVFVGFCTDICVISNVLTTKAVTEGNLPIVVIKDACAGTTVVNHEAALQVMRSCHIDTESFGRFSDSSFKSVIKGLADIDFC